MEMPSTVGDDANGHVVADQPALDAEQRRHRGGVERETAPHAGATTVRHTSRQFARAECRLHAGSATTGAPLTRR